MKARVVWLLVVVVAVSGCTSVRSVLGIQGPGNPTIELKSAEPRWLLINNPRFGDVRSEPEYIWVEEDKVPTTITTLLRGQSAIIAQPEIVAKYGTPPGGGKISPRQGTMYQTAESPKSAAANRGGAALAAAPTRATASIAPTPVSPAPAPKPPERGYVVYVDSARVVIDLTNLDGLRPGAVLSLRRDRIPIVHPVTGELLGELDEEVATARVTEIRDRFSVAEVQSLAPGAQVQVRDRVVLK